MSGLKKLIHEIHRRSVWQVLGIYIVVSWVVLQVVETLTSGIGLPNWVFPFSLILLALGLPIVVATAFVQEGAPGRKDARPFSDDALPTAAGTPPGSGPDRSAGPASRVLTWRNMTLGGVAVFVLLGLVTAAWLAARSLGIGPAGTLIAQGVLEERELLILADFESPDSAMAQAATELLRIDLAGSPAVALMSQDDLKAALRRMDRNPDEVVSLETARELAIREGIKGVIHGSINALGSGYVVSAELVAAEDGAVLVPLRETAADPDEVIPAVDKLSGRLRERVGESLRSVQGRERLSRLTTGSLQALQKLVAAQRTYAATGDHQTAVELLEEAVALDTTFAYAYRTLTAIYNNEGLGRERLVEYMTRAMRFRDRLPEAERNAIEAMYHATVTRDDEAAAHAYRRILAAGDSSELNNLAVMYMRLRRFEDAEEARELARTRGARSWQVLGGLVNAKYALGKREEAEQMLAYAMAENPDSARWEDRKLRFTILDGRYDEAQAAIDAFELRHSENPGWNLNAPFRRYELYRLQGRYAAAETELQGAVEMQAQRGFMRAFHNNTALLAEFRADRGDPQGGERLIEETLARHPLDSLPANERPYLSYAAAMARLGQLTEAHRWIEEWERSVDREIADPRGYGTNGPDAWIALQEDRALDAVELFRANDRGFQCPMCLFDEIGLAYDRAGMPDSAIALYGRYLDTPWLYRTWNDAQVKPQILERLGQLYDERGDLENAARYYAQFVELWAGADDELQPRVQAAQARLEEILAERG